MDGLLVMGIFRKPILPEGKVNGSILIQKKAGCLIKIPLQPGGEEGGMTVSVVSGRL